MAEKKSPAAAAPEALLRRYRATLDADRIYWGVEVVGEIGLDDVEVAQHCDLKPGHYRWNAEAKPVPRFDPLERESRKSAPEAPSRDKALAQLVDALAASGATIPEYTRKWREWFATTIDAR
jgi:hypothetical protein